MNLIGDPWIPVLDADGTAANVGLGDLYERAEAIRDLALPPLQRIAVMRLLLCVTHAALDGPKDEEEWACCGPRVKPESLAYLGARRDRFELYGKRPFLQVAGLEPVRNARLDKLDFGLASGDNDTLYDHRAGGPPRWHSPAWQALHLLVLQLFAQSSSKITRTTWGGRVTPASPKHAPAAVESALHAFVRGDSILESIRLSLATRADLDCTWGQPVWDVQIPHHESPEAEAVVQSYLGRLVPLARGILLEEGAAEFTLVDGLTYEKPPAGREPTATVIMKKRPRGEEPGYLSVDPQKHPWREAPSVLALEGGAGGPLTLRHLIRHRDLGIVDIWLGGLALVKAAKVDDTAEWVWTVPVELVGEAPLQTYGAGVREADSAAGRLQLAVRDYVRSLRQDRGALDGLRRRALRAFWSALDQQHSRLIEASLAELPELDGWCHGVQRAAQQAYYDTCAHVTPRQIQAFAAGRRML